MDELLQDIRNNAKNIVFQYIDLRGDRSSIEKGRKSNCFGNANNHSDNEDESVSKCFGCKGTKKKND
jgi:hypothetical protein